MTWASGAPRPSRGRPWPGPTSRTKTKIDSWTKSTWVPKRTNARTHPKFRENLVFDSRARWNCFGALYIFCSDATAWKHFWLTADFQTLLCSVQSTTGRWTFWSCSRTTTTWRRNARRPGRRCLRIYRFVPWNCIYFMLFWFWFQLPWLEDIWIVLEISNSYCLLI